MASLVNTAGLAGLSIIAAARCSSYHLKGAAQAPWGRAARAAATSNASMIAHAKGPWARRHVGASVAA